MSKLRSKIASLNRAAASLHAGASGRGGQSVWDTRAPRDALHALGAVQEIREDAHGETRGGWWLDGVWLARDMRGAFEAIGSDEAFAALRGLTGRAEPKTAPPQDAAEPVVPVMFRVWKSGKFKGDVDALFPTLEGSPGEVTSYAHVGQHGSADLHFMLRVTRPATPAEYTDLKRELEQIGYRLRVVQRTPKRSR